MIPAVKWVPFTQLRNTVLMLKIKDDDHMVQNGSDDAQDVPIADATQNKILPEVNRTNVTQSKEALKAKNLPRAGNKSKFLSRHITYLSQTPASNPNTSKCSCKLKMKPACF